VVSEAVEFILDVSERWLVRSSTDEGYITLGGNFHGRAELFPDRGASALYFARLCSPHMLCGGDMRRIAVHRFADTRLALACQGSKVVHTKLVDFAMKSPVACFGRERSCSRHRNQIVGAKLKEAIGGVGETWTRIAASISIDGDTLTSELGAVATGLRAL